MWLYYVRKAMVSLHNQTWGQQQLQGMQKSGHLSAGHIGNIAISGFLLKDNHVWHACFSQEIFLHAKLLAEKSLKETLDHIIFKGQVLLTLIYRKWHILIPRYSKNIYKYLHWNIMMLNEF